MTCEETHVMLHALIDSELDAGHAREVEAHVASCARCAAQLRDYRGMHEAMSTPAMRYQAPESLRARIEAALPRTTLPAPRAIASSRRPWFNGRVDVAPPVIDLTPQGFTLVGGRLDYIDGRPVAAIVYKRRAHVINLFVSQTAGSGSGASMEKLQGFTVWSWAWSDLSFRAVSDINGEELQEFGDKLETAIQHGGS